MLIENWILESPLNFLFNTRKCTAQPAGAGLTSMQYIQQATHPPTNKENWIPTPKKLSTEAKPDFNDIYLKAE